MSSSSAKEEDMKPSSHLKSTMQGLKESVVDGAGRFARGDSSKSTAQALKETDVEKDGDKLKDGLGVNKQ